MKTAFRVEVTPDIAGVARAMKNVPPRAVRRVMGQVGHKVSRKASEYLSKVTRTWSKKPRFDIKSDITPNSFSVGVSTDDAVFHWLNEGTGLYGPKARKYPIRPKRPGYPLKFQAGYRAKTSPGWIGSRAGGAYGETVRAMEVWHPGVKSRKWMEAIYPKLVKLARTEALKELRKQVKVLWRNTSGGLGGLLTH